MDFDSLSMENPVIKEIQSLYSRKLYHDVFLKIDSFLACGSNKSLEVLKYLEDLLIPECYDEFSSSELGYNIHALETANLSVKVAKCKKAFSSGSAIKFLSKCLQFIHSSSQKDDKVDFTEATLVLKTNQAILKYESGITEEANSVLKEVEKYLKEKNSNFECVDPELQKQHYFLGMNYYRGDSHSDAGKFLDAALHYLTYTPASDLDGKMQMGMARDIIHAAIYSKDTFNFGKVLFHPIMNSLKGSKHENLLGLLRAFDEGSMVNFDKFKFSLEDDGNKLTSNQMKQLQEKMRLMALMVMCWKLEPNKRIVHFTDIARCCALKENSVEIALMRAMSVGLICGTIDQVKGNVTITSVKPRDINRAGVGALLTKVEGWLDKVEEVKAKIIKQ